jgi:hypothetical protein
MDDGRKVLITIALSAAIVLSTILPAWAAGQHRRVTHTWCPTPLVAVVPRPMVDRAAAVARDLALAHHQIAGD